MKENGKAHDKIDELFFVHFLPYIQHDDNDDSVYLSLILLQSSGFSSGERMSIRNRRSSRGAVAGKQHRNPLAYSGTPVSHQLQSSWDDE